MNAPAHSRSATIGRLRDAVPAGAYPAASAGRRMDAKTPARQGPFGSMEQKRFDEARRTKRNGHADRQPYGRDHTDPPQHRPDNRASTGPRAMRMPISPVQYATA